MSPEDHPLENAAESGPERLEVNPARELNDAEVDFFQETPPSSRARQPVTALESVSPMGRTRQTSVAGTFWFLMGCNLLVFVSSMGIMVLELTASRLMAKHVGNSLYTWTSVIGVVLAGITVGNYLGGWLADRCDPKRLLGWLFFSSSLLSFAVLWLDPVAGELDRGDMSWPLWVLSLVAGMFFLPSMALGTISPVVAALALSRSARTGITVGNVYAWGALGSIVGTFLCGFYLIDTFGTKAIIGITAGSLAVMGVLMAGRQRAFRAAVLFGWLQFVTVISLAAAVHGTPPGIDAALADGLHRLGLALKLRDDLPGEYHDESNYSYIHVGETTEDGERVKFLKLDKLIHSYYNPNRPGELYYEYENVYAAVTEAAVVQWDRTTSVPLPAFPGRADVLAGLPAWIRFDADQQALVLHGGLTSSRRDELLALSSSADYWNAIEHLYERTNTPGWEGFESIALDAWPEGVDIPKNLTENLRYDPAVQLLNAYEPITDEDRQQLIAAAPDAAFYNAVDQLYLRSRGVSTMFLGGGGFVFPRWIEAKFPDHPRIDVAELDPAVKRAVRRELGLPPDDETAIHTDIGDARNVVDDRLQANAELKRAGKPPVLYDFVYGDAFNDFSVPWHLTTREFTEKIARLLKPQGVYLVNVIDILPRTTFGATSESDSVGSAQDGQSKTPQFVFGGPVPEVLLPQEANAVDWTPCPAPFEGLEVRRVSLDGNTFELAVHGRMSDAMRQRLLTLASDGHRPEGGPPLQQAVEALYHKSRGRQAGRFLASYVNTAAQVFANVYVFSSERDGPPTDVRDTFVIVCSQQRLDLSGLEATGYWENEPFAAIETDETAHRQQERGQMEVLLQLAGGLVLTDDFAPVDNLLIPVFVRQE